MMEALLNYYHALFQHVPGVVLWLGACVGHTFLWMVSINVFYALPLYHKIQDFCRNVDFLIILLGPLLFAPVLGPGIEAWSPLPSTVVWFFSYPYLASCFLLGVTAAPLAQTLYWLRRPAPQISSKSSKVVDFVRELGFRPRGRSKIGASTTLPGNQAFEVEYVDLHLRLPQLPIAWDGLTILHLTDLHFHNALDKKFYQAVMDRCQQWETPDLVCFTGDLIDSAWHHRWILPILGRLRWKVAGLSILGNHDMWWEPSLIRRRLTKVGFKDVGNTWKKIDVRGEPLIVVGHEGPWIRPAPDLKDCPADIFRLCLSHTPDNIAWAQRHRMDLMLSGHVHGGQIRFPLIGSLYVPSRYSRKYDCGTFYEAPTVLHVGRGLAGKHPLRFHCRPEVTRLVLHRGKDNV
jgi:predicted MPP superfamily phosphohydrolase